jgi:hypothetical protein
VDGFDWTVPDVALTGMDADPDAYFGVGQATLVDDLGRRWVLDHVDLEEAELMRDQYDFDVSNLFTPEPGQAVETGWELEEMAGQTMWVEPQAWLRYDCTVDGSTST